MDSPRACPMNRSARFSGRANLRKQLIAGG
jgi:hypothetical protein